MTKRSVELTPVEQAAFNDAVMVLRGLYSKEGKLVHSIDQDAEQAYAVVRKVANRIAKHTANTNEALLDAWALIRIPEFPLEEVLDQLYSSAAKSTGIDYPLSLSEITQLNEERSLRNADKLFGFD